MIKIKISYQNAQELHTVLRLLHPVIKSCKLAKEPRGEYKKAYVILK